MGRKRRSVECEQMLELRVGDDPEIPASTDSYCTDKMYKKNCKVWERVAAVKASEAGKLFAQSKSRTGIYDTLREPNHLIFYQPPR